MSASVTDAPVAPLDAKVNLGPKRLQQVTLLMPVISLVVILVALTIADSTFLTERNLQTLVGNAVPLILLATGATLVVICGGIDLSIAAMASLCTVFFALWLPHLGGLTLPAVVLAAAAIGAIQGLLHVVLRIPSFVVTLGGMSIFSSVGLVISHHAPVAVSQVDAPQWIRFVLARGSRPSKAMFLDLVPIVFVVAVVLVAVVALVLRLTPLQSYLTATGYSEASARLAGVPVDAVKVGAFAFSGACAGLAAVVIATNSFAGNYNQADTLLLPAVAAIVVGGTAITGGHGSLWRSLAGALVITLLRAGLPIVGVPSAYEQILYGAIIVGAVALTLDRSKVLIIK